MYECSLQIDSKYDLTCFLVINRNIVKVQDFMLDTGAIRTCVPARCLGKAFISQLKKVDNDGLWVKGAFTDKQNLHNYRVHFWEYEIPQFVVGNVDLQNQRILITEDPKYHLCALGMDILSKLDFWQDSVDSKIMIAKSGTVRSLLKQPDKENNQQTKTMRDLLNRIKNS